MEKIIKVQEVETGEDIPAYDVPPMFPTYDSLMKGAMGKKAK